MTDDRTAEERYRDALERIGELLEDWPTMRALSASGAEKATANKKAAREIISDALYPENSSDADETNSAGPAPGR